MKVVGACFHGEPVLLIAILIPAHRKPISFRSDREYPETPECYRTTTMNALTLYNEIWSSSSELEARCKESLNPRGADILYEAFASFGPTAGSVVIDIG